MKPICEICGEEAAYCDSSPDAAVLGITPNECGYRLVPLCWVHAHEREECATSRIREVLIYQGEAFLDLGRASGDCICEHCGLEYRRHKRYFDHCPTQVILCGERTAKL